MRELPKGWVWTTLGQLGELVGGITKGQRRKAEVPTRLVPYLRVANVQRGYLDLSEIKLIAATEEEINRLRLEPGDVLLNEGGDRDKLGRGWVWREQLQECVHQNHVFRLRVNPSIAVPEFVAYYANEFGQSYFFAEGKHTTNLASISMRKISALPVPLPSVSEQNRIVGQIDNAFTALDHLEGEINRAVQRVTRLRRSILTIAFEGKLLGDPANEQSPVVPQPLNPAVSEEHPGEAARYLGGRKAKA